MLEYEATGKSVEKAVEEALLVLKAPREDVDIKILDEGGFLKKARIFAKISDDCVEKYQKKQEVRANMVMNKSDDVDEFISKQEKVEIEGNNEQKKAEKESLKAEKKEAKEEQKLVKKFQKEESKSSDSSMFVHTNGVEFLKGLLKMMGIEASVLVEDTEENIQVNITSEKAGDLIGYRGECINALQYIASTIQANGENKRIILDIENYRAKREETLRSLARRMAKKVAKTNRSVKLEPMTANERRIIHMELQQDENVETTSKGIEPNRYLIIFPKKESEQN